IDGGRSGEFASFAESHGTRIATDSVPSYRRWIVLYIPVAAQSRSRCAAISFPRARTASRTSESRNVRFVFALSRLSLSTATLDTVRGGIGNGAARAFTLA